MLLRKYAENEEDDTPHLTTPSKNPFYEVSTYCRVVYMKDRVKLMGLHRVKI